MNLEVYEKQLEHSKFNNLHYLPLLQVYLKEQKLLASISRLNSKLLLLPVHNRIEVRVNNHLYHNHSNQSLIKQLMSINNIISELFFPTGEYNYGA